MTDTIAPRVSKLEADVAELKAHHWDLSRTLMGIKDSIRASRSEYASANTAITAALGRLEAQVAELGRPAGR